MSGDPQSRSAGAAPGQIRRAALSFAAEAVDRLERENAALRSLCERQREGLRPLADMVREPKPVHPSRSDGHRAAALAAEPIPGETAGCAHAPEVLSRDEAKAPMKNSIITLAAPVLNEHGDALPIGSDVVVMEAYDDGSILVSADNAAEQEVSAYVHEGEWEQRPEEVRPRNAPLAEPLTEQGEADHCSQCGQSFGAPACGPTHALIAHERGLLPGGPPAAPEPEPEGAEDPWPNVTREQARALLRRAERDLSDLGAEDGLLAVGLTLGRRSDEIADLREQARQDETLAAQQRTRIEGLELQAASAERWRALAVQNDRIALRQNREKLRLRRLVGVQQGLLRRLLDAVAQERHGGTMGEAAESALAELETAGVLSDPASAAALAELTALRGRAVTAEDRAADLEGSLAAADEESADARYAASEARGEALALRERAERAERERDEWQGVAETRKADGDPEMPFREIERLQAKLAEQDAALRAAGELAEDALCRVNDHQLNTAADRLEELLKLPALRTALSGEGSS